MMSDRDISHREMITQFIGMIAKASNSDRSFASFLEKYAAYHNPAPRPQSLKRLAAKQCFANAQRSVLAAVKAGREPLTYAEGYACSGSIAVPLPIHHAWLVDQDGNVVDRTWESPETSTYFGVAFTADYVVSKAQSRKHDWSLLDNREDGWELLRDPDVARAVLIHPSAAGMKMR